MNSESVIRVLERLSRAYALHDSVSGEVTSLKAGDVVVYRFKEDTLSFLRRVPPNDLTTPLCLESKQGDDKYITQWGSSGLQIAHTLSLIASLMGFRCELVQYEPDVLISLKLIAR